MIFLFLVFIALLLYYIFFLNSISRGLQNILHTNQQESIDDFVSVIIPFRNEERNILTSLESISSQSFPKDKHEIIYIDDNSDDSSVSLLENSNKNENVIILKSPNSSEKRGHKKMALSFAISEAKGEIIITTDADCVHGPDWLQEMVSCFDSNTAFVSGPVQFKGKDRLFEKLQELEFSSLILVGAGLIGANFPIICNAANLGFRKSVFEQVGGYEDNINVSSGDDEFLMQKIFANTRYKIKFCFKKSAFALTNPNKSISEFYHQRKRWASKGFLYFDKRITIKLMLIFSFYFGIPIQIFLGFFYNDIFLFSSLITLIIKFVLEYKILSIDSQGLFDRPRILYFLIAETLHIPYIIISGISGLFGNYKWKGRRIVR